MRKICFIISMLLGISVCAAAEPYPNKPVIITVPYAPGNTTDIVARLIAQQLSEQLKSPFIVENRPGAGGIIGNGVVAKSAPDGYSLSMADFSFVTAPALYKSVPWDPIKDFTIITQVTGGAQVLVVSPSLNVSTLKDFLALVRANPGKFNYGSGGTGSGAHLTGELFKSIAKLDIVHVPYKGASEAANALLGNQVQMQFSSIPPVLSNIKGGQMRALAITSDGTRSPTLPDVPSMREAGLPEMVNYSWFGLVGPAGMPPEIVNTLHLEVAKAVAVPAIKDKFNALGSEAVGSSPEEFSALINSEIQRWTAVIKNAGITLE